MTDPETFPPTMMLATWLAIPLVLVLCEACLADKEAAVGLPDSEAMVGFGTGAICAGCGANG